MQQPSPVSSQFLPTQNNYTQQSGTSPIPPVALSTVSTPGTQQPPPPPPPPPPQRQQQQQSSTQPPRLQSPAAVTLGVGGGITVASDIAQPPPPRGSSGGCSPGGSTNSGRRTILSFATALSDSASAAVSGSSTPFLPPCPPVAPVPSGDREAPISIGSSTSMAVRPDIAGALVDPLSSPALDAGSERQPPVRRTLLYRSGISQSKPRDGDGDGDGDNGSAGPSGLVSNDVVCAVKPPLVDAAQHQAEAPLALASADTAEVAFAPRFGRRKGFRIGAGEAPGRSAENEIEIIDDDDDDGVDPDGSENAPLAKVEHRGRQRSPGLPGEWGGEQPIKKKGRVEKGDAEEEEDAAPKDPLAQLSDEQREAFRLVVTEGRSVFITGGAGTGKSHLLRTIIQYLPRGTTFVTATTGIAAMNLGGTTVHSFAGCGIVEEGAELKSIAACIKAKKPKRQTWQRCTTLIVDEISMLSAYMFDMLEYVARFVRGRGDPFGGIQLVLTGDFLQLPPVRKNGRYGAPPKGPTFPFQSAVWLKVNPQVCLLSKPYRQRNMGFFHLLNEMRFGEMSGASIEKLAALSDTSSVNMVGEISPGMADMKDLRLATVEAPGAGGGGRNHPPPHQQQSGFRQFAFTNANGAPLRLSFDGYINLRSKRDEVDQQNDFYYRQLDRSGGSEYMYRGHHTGQGDFPDKTIQPLVRLRVGCRVMLIKNFDVVAGLVNGSTGTVVGFADCGKNYEFKNGMGITVREARLVCRGVDGDTDRSHLMLPVVCFELMHRKKTITITVEPHEWKEERGDEVLSRTYQMPLILAYAITIHKSQGMSLTQVDIDLKSIFEAGQAYVALSRCTDLDKVRLHGFNQSRVHPDSAALAYYKALDIYCKRIDWQERRRRRQRRMEAAAAPSGGGQEPEDALAENDRLRTRSFTPYGYEAGPSQSARVSSRADEERHRDGRRRHWADDTASSSSDSDSDSGKGKDGSRQRQRRRQHSGRLLRTTESTHLDGLRQYVTGLLTASQEVRSLVVRLAVPATWLRDARLVVDTTAMFYLITGTDSVAVFRDLTERNGNMLRLPLAVKRFISNLADSVDSARGAGEEADTAGAEPGTGAAAAAVSDPSTCGGGDIQGEESNSGGGEEEEDGLAAMQSLIEAAAVGLGLVDEWKANFILDEQREGERLSLLPCGRASAAAAAVVLPSWHKYGSILPLLQPLIPGLAGGTTPSQTTTTIRTNRTVDPNRNEEEGDDETDTDGETQSVSEVSFLLNRDPREACTHLGILEYALYLHSNGGSRVVVCTDSPILAAYALALNLPAVTVGALANGG